MENSITSATFVVIGGGIAGVSCVEQLSLLCPKESIILVSSSDVVKAVTNLSKVTQWLTTFDVTEKSIDEFSSKTSNVKVFHSHVEKLNPDKQVIFFKFKAFTLFIQFFCFRHEVSTSTCGKINYKYLCLCHGARPKIIEGENEFVIAIRDTESVNEVKVAIKYF